MPKLPTFESQSKSDFPKQVCFGSNTLIKVLPDEEKKKLFHSTLAKTGIQGSIFSFIWSWKILTLATSSQEACKSLEKLIVISDTVFWEAEIPWMEESRTLLKTGHIHWLDSNETSLACEFPHMVFSFARTANPQKLLFTEIKQNPNDSSIPLYVNNM